jgi:hypothetical protein
VETIVEVVEVVVAVPLVLVDVPDERVVVVLVVFDEVHVEVVVVSSQATTAKTNNVKRNRMESIFDFMSLTSPRRAC